MTMDRTWRLAFINSLSFFPILSSFSYLSSVLSTSQSLSWSTRSHELSLHHRGRPSQHYSTDARNYACATLCVLVVRRSFASRAIVPFIASLRARATIASASGTVVLPPAPLSPAAPSCPPTPSPTGHPRLLALPRPRAHPLSTCMPTGELTLTSTVIRHRALGIKRKTQNLETNLNHKIVGWDQASKFWDRVESEKNWGQDRA